MPLPCPCPIPVSQDGVFRILAAILHLGNVLFEETEDGGALKLKGEQEKFHLSTVVELLG